MFKVSVLGVLTLDMVGGGQQIGPNPDSTRGWIAPQQQGGDPFGGAYGSQGHHLKRGPFQQGFGDPSKLATNNSTSLDINYQRDHYPPMEQRDPSQQQQQVGGGEGAVVDQQRGVWGQEGGGRVESEYQVAGGRDLSISEGSQSDGSEDEEEDEEDEDDDEEDDMVDNDDDKEGPQGVAADQQQVEGVASLPLSHSPMRGQIRQEHGFQRNMADRATLKAAIGTAAGTSNSPFGMFQSPSSTLPFLNSFSSPSNSTPHSDVTPSQNGGGGMAVIASASGASYALTREGGLSRDVTRESSFRETTTVVTQEPSSRISSGPLHEQLQTTDVDNYYTTLLNTQVPPNNGLNKTAADSASRRMADPQSTAESSLRRILSDPLT